MSRAGSIKRDDSGRWGFVVDTTPPGAARRRQVRKRGFATKREAQEALTLTLATLQDGSFVAPDKMTVGQYLDRWLDSLPAAGRRPSTVSGYRRTVEVYALDHIGEVGLQQLSALELDKLYGDLLDHGRRQGEGGLSARTVRYLHTILSKALSDAERKGLVVRNVARLASPPSSSSAQAPEMTAWTPTQLRTFLAANQDHHHATLWHLAAMSGLRRGEACGLRWTDVDLDAGMLRVRRTLLASGQDVIEGEPKTRRSRRTVDLDASTVTMLRAHRREQLEQRMMMGAGFTDLNLVFAQPDGKPWHPGVITRAFDRRVRSMPDLPRIRFHDLRHGHASHLLAAGVNVKVVSERLGHSSVGFTLDVYAHVMPGQGAEAAAAAAALVGCDHSVTNRGQSTSPLLVGKGKIPGHRGALGRIRTCDRRIRSPVLCPAELRGQRSSRRPAS